MSSFSLKNDNWCARITILTWSPNFQPQSSGNYIADQADELDDPINNTVILLPAKFETLYDGSYDDIIGKIEQAPLAGGDVPSSHPDEERGLLPVDLHRKRLHHQTSTGNRLMSENDILLYCCFELQSSSIMLTTNSFGDFSKSCIVSECINDDELKEMSEEIRKMRLRFIHQQQTARCVAYLLMLRRVIERTVTQYRNAQKAVINGVSIINSLSLKNY